MATVNYDFMPIDDAGLPIPVNQITSVKVYRTGTSDLITDDFLKDLVKIVIQCPEEVCELVDIHVNGQIRKTSFPLITPAAVNKKIDQIPAGTAGHLVGIGETGNFEDTGVASENVVQKEEFDAIDGTDNQSFRIGRNETTPVNLVLVNGTLAIKLNDGSYAPIRASALLIDGDPTEISKETIKVSDNEIELNSDVTTGTPTEDMGLRGKRGNLADTLLQWSETAKVWMAGVVGTMSRILLESDLGSTVAKGTDGRDAVTSADDADVLYLGDGEKITKADLFAGIAPPSGEAYAGQFFADAADTVGGVASEKVDQNTITVDETAHKITLKRPKINGVSTASGYYKIAETAINPGNYYALLRVTVYGTSDATIQHELLIRINGYGISAPSYDILSSCLTQTAAGSGIRYVRVTFPKAAGNGYKAQIEINFYDATSRTYEIQMLDCKNMTLLSAIATSDYNSTYQNILLSATLQSYDNYGSSFSGTFSGNASSANWTTATVAGGTAGQSLAPNDIVGEASSNDKLYKLSGSPTLHLNAKIGSSYGTYAADAAANMNVCGNQAIQANLVGTRTAGKDLFARGTISEATFMCDGTITTELAGGYSYKRIGFLLTESTVIFDGNNAVYTLDASGKLTMIDGVAVYAADSAALEGHVASYFQVADADLAAIAALSTTGLLERLGDGSYQTTTVAASSREVTVSETLTADTYCATQAIGDTTITFQSESARLGPGNYFLVESEIQLLGTLVSGLTYNVTRERFGTTKVGHAAGSRLYLYTESETWAANTTDKLRLIAGALGTNKRRTITLESGFTSVIAKSTNVSSVSGTTVTLSDSAEYWILGY